MLLDIQQEERLADLEGRLQRAQAITSELISALMTNGCVRLNALSGTAKAKLNSLVAAGAWTDSAMTLLQLEMPQWKLRRLIKDDGQWFCSLSKQPELPIGFDEVAEASHENLAVAILLAFVQARRASSDSATSRGQVPYVRPVTEGVVCCDNFA